MNSSRGHECIMHQLLDEPRSEKCNAFVPSARGRCQCAASRSCIRRAFIRRKGASRHELDRVIRQLHLLQSTCHLCYELMKALSASLTEHTKPPCLLHLQQMTNVTAIVWMITRQTVRDTAFLLHVSQCHHVSKERWARVVGIVGISGSFRRSTYFPFLDEKSFRVMRSTKDEAADWSLRCRRPRPCCSRGVGPHVRDQDRSMTSGLENHL